MISPVWDGTNGATILSFDYRNWVYGNFWAGMEMWVSNGTSEARFAFVGLMTAQVFDAPGRHGWQRAEIDVSQWIAPSSTMTMKFASYCGFPVSEFGIDNVRIDRATACARSGLRIQSATIDDAAPGWGNANGVLEPGETARVQVRLANDGTATAFSPVATLRVEAEGALVHESLRGGCRRGPGASPAAAARRVVRP